jgi:hypothetical protein
VALSVDFGMSVMTASFGRLADVWLIARKRRE